MGIFVSRTTISKTLAKRMEFYAAAAFTWQQDGV